ncbi:hypothetical protein BpHYR1_020761 [Brachionus plicatilis]|uniref:Uncharacterized protein n=1 Tax=Brachionus plicatilis TaxID=10195 RepID=A0A3M7SQG4_BRAPC|nr:hypothetical protein BpHYR1_020761 [Brachionus plicatilis]
MISQFYYFSHMISLAVNQKLSNATEVYSESLCSQSKKIIADYFQQFILNYLISTHGVSLLSLKNFIKIFINKFWHVEIQVEFYEILDVTLINIYVQN